MTEQEGKLQEEKTILGDYFPDINTTLNQVTLYVGEVMLGFG